MSVYPQAGKVKGFSSSFKVAEERKIWGGQPKKTALERRRYHRHGDEGHHEANACNEQGVAHNVTKSQAMAQGKLGTAYLLFVNPFII